MSNRPIAFQVRADDGTVVNVRVGSAVWGQYGKALKGKPVGTRSEFAGMGYTKISEDRDE